MTKLTPKNPPGKLDVSSLYNAPSPQPYLNFLKKHDYFLPDYAAGHIKRLAQHLRQIRVKNAIKVLDLGCSYGVLPAAFRFGISMESLYNYYGEKYDPLKAAENSYEADKLFLRQKDISEKFYVVGADPAEAAVRYATSVGLIDEGYSHSLEDENQYTESFVSSLSNLDVVVSTGVIGYVSPLSIDGILKNSKSRPWMLHFVLRGVDFKPFQDLLANRGYVTQESGQIYKQRRFDDASEQNAFIDNLKNIGIDPSGYETLGYSCAVAYLSRPVSEKPIDDFFNRLAS